MTGLTFAEDFDAVTREHWLGLVEKVLKGADFDKRLVATTADGLRIDPLYTRADALAGAAAAVPGAAPFTRGGRGLREGFGWDIRQLHAETDPKAATAAIIEDLAGGVTSVAIQMEAPGQFGLPPLASAFETALKGVDLSICPVALQAGDVYHDGAGFLMAAWRAQGIADADRCGAFNADPLGTLAATGGLYHSLDKSLAGAAGLLAETRAMPQVTALIADGRPYHAAGASEAQELATMLASFVAYLRAAAAAGVAPGDAIPKIAIGLAADTDQFMTIAKLRAARALLWRVADASGAGAAAGKVHMTVATSWRMLARRDPWVNMLRATIACTAAALGGADAITVLPFTAAMGRPDAFARRIARNTQIVLQEESSLGRVIDPAGGSWYVEKLTDDLARKAWGLFQEIEAKGGMGKALTSGFVQGRIAAAAEARAKQVATGRVPVTGVSAFPKPGDDGVTVEPNPPALSAKLNGAKAKALVPARLAAPFEALRDAADAFATKTAATPRVFLANLGQLSEFNARATWAKNFFASGGIEAISNDGFTSSVTTGAAFGESGAEIACICSSDAVYAELAEAVAGVLKAAGAKAVYLAGKPADAETLKAAGVDGFLHAGCDMLEALRAAHGVLGVEG